VSNNRSGFTLVEMLVAVVILAVGLLALAGSTGIITRTLHGSRIATQAVQQAQQRIDILRAAARSTPTPCSSPSFASSAGVQLNQGVSMTWSVPPSGGLRTVRVITSYSLGRGRTKVDTLSTNIDCT